MTPPSITASPHHSTSCPGMDNGNDQLKAAVERTSLLWSEFGTPRHPIDAFGIAYGRDWHDKFAADLRLILSALEAERAQTAALRQEVERLRSASDYTAQVFVMLVANSERGAGGHGKLIDLRSEEWDCLLKAQAKNDAARLLTQESSHVG